MDTRAERGADQQLPDRDRARLPHATPADHHNHHNNSHHNNHSSNKMTNIFSLGVLGEMSPYPTVEMVTSEK